MIANFAGHGDPARARWAGRCPASRRRCSRAATTAGPVVATATAVAGHRAGRRGRAGAAARLAVDVPRLPHEEERYRRCFAGGWYLTGDLARRDADGYYWFVGRADDVIKSAGHLIGPFEVESVLMEHPAVAEAA